MAVRFHSAGEAVARGLLAQGFARPHQFLLQCQHPLSGQQAGAQLIHLEGLHDVVVRAGFHTFHHVFQIRADTQQHHVNIPVADTGAHFPADLRAFHAGHHPIEQCQARSVLLPQMFPGLLAIGHYHHLVAPLEQHLLQHVAEHRAVVRNQNRPGRRVAQSW